MSDAAQAAALAGLQALVGDSVPPEVLRYALSRHNWNGDEAALYVLDGGAARDFEALARARGSGGGGAAGADGGMGTGRRRDDGRAPASSSAATTAAAAAAAEERDSAERQRVKAAVMQRFDERPDMSDVTFTPSLPREMLGGGTGRGGGGAKKLLRYVDGREVWVGKGERFIVEEVGPAAPPMPASFIKVKKKGQGGATPGFKK